MFLFQFNLNMARLHKEHKKFCFYMLANMMSFYAKDRIIYLILSYIMHLV